MDADNLNEQLKLQQRIVEIEEAAKRYMTREAITRYGNLKTAYPELAINVASMIANAAKAGEINMIDDKTFKEILKNIQGNKRETKIRKI